MDRAGLLEQVQLDALELLDLGQVERSDDWVTLTTPGGSEQRNGVFRCVTPEAEIEARIDRAIRHFSPAPWGFRWCVQPSSRPLDLGARLLARGFEHVETLEGMCLSTDHQLPGAELPLELTALTVEEIDDWAGVMRQVTGFPEEVHERLRGELARTLSRPESKPRYFLARHDGVPVGATSLAQLSHVGHLFGAAVVPSHRGRGIYREMIRSRLAWLQARGCELATVHCISTTSAPICRRFGFQAVCCFENYRYRAPGGPGGR